MSQASETAQALLDAGRADEAVQTAQAAAARGDGDGALLIALWRLAGTSLPRDLGEARRLLRLAADAGNADAALMEVALIANGTGDAPDWSLARERLEAAARIHCGAAAEHLDLLSRMAINDAGMPTRLPECEILSERPLVKRWRGLLNAAECAHIARSVQDILGPSLVADPATGRLIAHPIRTSSAAQVGPTRESLPIRAILHRIAAISDSDVTCGEPLTVLHYAPGQQYRAHNDALPGEANQRVSTVIVYLNEGYAGGETAFAQGGPTVSGKGGDALFWSNVTPDGRPDPASRHAGLPVRQGAKWAVTRWIRARPLDVWNLG